MITALFIWYAVGLAFLLDFACMTGKWPQNASTWFVCMTTWPFGAYCVVRQSFNREWQP